MNLRAAPAGRSSGPRHLMELRQLRYVEAVARHRHFTRAAEELHVAQSALSHQVRRLEAELGTELFARTSRTVVPTEAGEAVAARARRGLAEGGGGPGGGGSWPRCAVGARRSTTCEAWSRAGSRSGRCCRPGRSTSRRCWQDSATPTPASTSRSRREQRATCCAISRATRSTPHSR